MKIAFCLLGLALSLTPDGVSTLPSDPATGPSVTSIDSARHALQRLAWGPTPGQIDRVATEGVARWIADQLAVTSVEVPGQRVGEAGRPALATSTAELIRSYASRRRAAAKRDSAGARIRAADPDQQVDIRTVLIDYGTLTLTRQATSTHQLAEVLADFWTNHFNVFLNKGMDRVLLRDHVEQAIRPHTLGRFEDLLLATATSPAMLFYLDNARSVAPRGAVGIRPARGINENYARELLELHTLGVEGGYSQADVNDVARALTGWGFDPQTGRFRFSAHAHDRGAKTILGVTFPPGGGEAEGRQVLHLLATHPSTVRHISTKLCARFVSDDPPATCVAAATGAWHATDGEIRAVVSAIVWSDAFWAEASQPTKVKSPHEFLVSALRALDADPARAPRLVAMLGGLGQPLFQQSAPTGWPERATEWVSSSALLARMNAALALVGGQVRGVRPAILSDVRLSSEPGALIDHLDHEILGGTMGTATRRTLQERMRAASDPSTMRQTAIGLILGSPEFQRQ